MNEADSIEEFHVHSPHIRILFAQERPTGDWKFKELRAPYWRLYHQSAPGAWIQQEQERIDLHPEFLYLIPPNTSFSSGNDQELHQLFVHFIIEPQVSERRLQKTVYDIPLRAGLQDILEQIRSTENPTKQSLLLLALVQSCLAGCQLQLVNRSDNSRLEEAQALMRRHLRDGISNPEIASALAMTTNAFIRWFSQSTGWPPQKWLNRERVHEASYWLHHNNASIDFIAETVGFCDRYHFSRVFKKIQGISPASFRKNREKLDAQLKV